MIRRVLIVSLLYVFAVTCMVAAADLVELVPADAGFVIRGNLNKLLSYASVKDFINAELAKQTPEEKARFEEFKKETGFDPYTSLTDVALYVAKGAVANPQEFGAVLFTGNFDGAKLVQAIAERDQSTIEQFEGCNAIKPRQGGEELLVVLDANTLVLGYAPGVKKVIEVKTGKAKGIAADSHFAAMLKKADTSATLWGAGQLPDEIKAQLKKDGLATFIADSSAILFSVNIEKLLTAMFLGEFDKSEAIEAAYASIQNFLSALKPMTESNKEAGELLNAIKAEKVAGGVKVVAILTPAQVDSIKKQILEKAQAPTKK